MRLPAYVQCAIPYLGVPVLAVWMTTLRMRWCDTHHVREARRRSGHIIYSFWHENLLYFAWSHRRRGVRTMISRHSDGQMIARTVELLGFHTTRGSTTRGGSSALKGMIRASEGGEDVAITPDGPRGPRRRLQPGIIHLAGRSGRAILPVAVRFERCRRVGSWDRMPLPRLFSRGVILAGESVVVSAADTEDEKRVEELREALEARMNHLHEVVERDFDRLHGEGLRHRDEADPPSPIPEAT